ncbi:S8 family serine peptidase [Pelomonas sp. KK5]|uniref:S8 family serine peptidase n=1 Tax=Pelomonas sp. KK5 TaxID=1855730 RepID=UPI00097C1BFA|nr:S8 family serine peptidase [Pelomonas sp. KK5]
MKKINKLTPAALAALALLSGLATGAHAADDRKTYIVQLKDEPAATYPGNVSGYAATQGTTGQPFQARSVAVQAYVKYLGGLQDSVSATVPNAPVLYRYANVLNGFAAQLTDAEVALLTANAKVASVVRDEPRQLVTISTSRFLGLSTPGGVWSKMVGSAAVKGENLVIGVIDGGIWPENPAFFDQVDASGAPVKSGGTLAYDGKPASFTGGCSDANGFVASRDCNNKLIGAKAFDEGFKAQKLALHWTDFASSPRDSLGNGGTLSGHGGHGDHTASTAAGNSQNPATITGSTTAPASGVAPRARVAAYKVCWTFVDSTATDGSGATNSCWQTDSVKAIDQAVADGVNAINFSISGSTSNVNDIVEQAFYRASLAGIFVAASAGNAPTTQVGVNHISPWLTTVAASNHDRLMSATLTLGDGTSYNGASLNTQALPATAMVVADDVGQGGGAANLCFSDATEAAKSNQVLLDPAKVAGKVVVCTRGTNARTDKSLAVKNAGGVGMVMIDNGVGLIVDEHSVPSVMLNVADGATVKTYARTGGSRAAIGTFFMGSQPAPLIAGFSLRGPNAGDANVLKPDLTAPGVDIIAQVTPPLTMQQKTDLVAGTFTPPGFWASYQGTSMSSPHVAGLSLLLKQAHPDWSPAAIKSALMTTSYTTLDDKVAGALNGLLPWAQGAGHVDPGKALDPGLVYDAGKADYVRYQCLINKAGVPAADCSTYGVLDATYNLNLPSITVANIPGTVTVKRSVTNVGSAAATYTGSVSVAGFTATVAPASLTLNPGETKAYTLTLTGNGAAKNAWAYGKLSWTDGSHQVVSPVQARLGDAISAPASLTANTASGARLFSVQTGFSGKMGAIKGGMTDVTMSATMSLAPKAVSPTTLLANCKKGTATANMAVHSISVPAGALVARFQLRQEDTGSPGDDHDMLVLYPNGTTASYSGADGTNEAIQVVLPAAGTYRACVAAYAGGATMTHQLSSWVVDPAAATSTKLNVLLPANSYLGGTATVGVSWSGLTMGHRYLGAAALMDAGGNFGSASTTVLRVEPNGGLPVAEAPDTRPDKLGLPKD